MCSAGVHSRRRGIHDRDRRLPQRRVRPAGEDHRRRRRHQRRRPARRPRSPPPGSRSTRSARASWPTASGFDYFFLTEHHFQPEGAEYSPNPLLTETAIAAQTKRIRLGQCANILTWHHPVRIAEQAAMLDVISGGRLEFGMGRGYQPRETEVLGGQMGATIQDQERNRAYFEEAYEIIMKCWTQESFSHHGEFFTIPPSYTRWNHKPDDRLLPASRASAAASRTSWPSATRTCTRWAARCWPPRPSCGSCRSTPSRCRSPTPRCGSR